MKIPCLLLFATVAPLACAGTAELNRTLGLWDFDGSLNARYYCFAPVQKSANLTIGSVAPGPYWTNGEWLDLSSDSVANAGLQLSEWVGIQNAAGANGMSGASYTNNWTVIMDVRWPAISGWAALVNDTSTSDGEVFRDNTGALRFWGAIGNPIASNVLSANTWYQLAFTAEYSAAAAKQVLRAYVNGVPTTQTSGGTVQVAADGIYGLAGTVYLFCDNNNETNRVQINSLGFWGETLSAADIAAIGAHSGSGMHWTGESESAICTPSGNLYFGGFLTTYNPATAGNIAATVTAATLAGAVADIRLVIPANTGVIPGKPQHKFGGTINGHLMPNGDVIMFGNGILVNYTGGGNDMETTANVTYRREFISLEPTGVFARTLNIYLPAGFGMAESDKTRVLKTAVSQYDGGGTPISLGAGLIPSGNISLNRGDFGMPTGGTNPTGMWAVLDRMPVRWPTNAIIWNAAGGTFTHGTTGTLIYHHEAELNFNVQLQLAGYPEGGVRPSNDQYLVFARSGIGSNVVAARTGGAAAVQNAVATIEVEKFSTTVPANMFMHYPLTAMIMGQGIAGRIAYVNDALDLTNSRLRNVTSNLLYSARTRASTGCTGVEETPAIAPETLVFTTPSNEWFFTPDGGIHAAMTFTTPEVIDWGGWKEGATTYFAHSITTAFAGGRALIAGHAFRGSEAASYQANQRAAAMLLTGHSAPGNEALAERPLTDSYADGAADYPGVNLRVSGTVNAVSRLAGVATPAYPLRNTSKYYLRADGVSGRHDSGGSGFSFNAFGADFSISALRLAFLDGLNTASGVNGSLTVPAPAQFGLSFRELLFGARGQLLAATVSPTQGDITLGAFWNFKFTPLSLDFPQPKVCPDPSPATGFVKIGAQAAIPGLVRDTTVTGALGFASGNIVVESDAVAEGLGPISRFEPGTLLTVPGPGTSNWFVNATSGIYLNKANVGGNNTGSLSAAGRMNLPFFEDMPVLVSMTSSNTGSFTPSIYTLRPWENFSSAVYDPGHIGHPPGVALADYRSAPSWFPNATRDWQDLITFNIPVGLDVATRSFQSIDYTDQDVFLFHLREGVKKMTPENAELLFDGEVNVGVSELLDQVNVSSLLGNPNLLTLPDGAVKDGLNGALASVGGLDALLTDNLAVLLKPGLQQVASDAISASYYNQLATATDREAKLNEIVPGIALGASGLLGSGVGGTWRTDLLAKVTAARSGMQSAKNIVQSAVNLQQLATAMKAQINGSSDPIVPDAERLAAIQQFLDQIIARLTALETALGASGDLTTALNSALLANGGPATWVQQAINDVKGAWAPSDSAAALAFYTGYPPSALADAIASALAERVAGSVFSGTAMQLLRQHLGDPQTMARQAVDDVLRFAENLISQALDSGGSVTSALGDLDQYTAAARLKGYARINGDSLAELRLDGQVRLKVPDEMKFDGWFLIRSLDSTTPNAACLAAGGAKAEVGAGASAEFNWGTPNMIQLGGKVALDGSGSPVGLCGDFGLTKDIDFQAVKMSNIKFGFGFGANNGYLYARGAGKMQTMDIAAGIFIGQTCDLGVIANADPDIGGLLPQVLPGYSLPVLGAMVYAEGGMSLMPLIGIPPSCVLDVRVSGGQGFFGFLSNGTPGPNGLPVVAGIKQKLGVSGELLCIVDVNGELVTVLAAQGFIKDGGLNFQGLSGTARATVRGEVGVGPFSWDFEKSLGLKIFANPSVSYSIDF